MNLLKLMSCFCFILLTSPAFGMLEDLDFDKIRENGGFAAPILSKAVSVSPSGRELTPAEIEEFFNSPYPVKLKTLSLQGQSNVDDAAIGLMCDKEAFARIINLDLRDTSITVVSLNKILESPHLGSIRDLPQISARYGMPSSTVFVRADCLSLSNDVIEAFNRGAKRKNGFVIKYKQPLSDKTTAAPASGIKLLEVVNY